MINLFTKFLLAISSLSSFQYFLAVLFVYGVLLLVFRISDVS